VHVTVVLNYDLPDPRPKLRHGKELTGYPVPQERRYLINLSEDAMAPVSGPQFICHQTARQLYRLLLRDGWPHPLRKSSYSEDRP
jgi:hypothetical protein